MSDSPAEPLASHAWALELPLRQAGAILALRLVPGVEVAEADDTLWLRGRAAEPATLRLLRAIPARARYDWLEGDALRSVGSRLGTARWPVVSWQLLRAWIQVTLPEAAPAPPASPASVPLELAPAAEWRAANAWLTTLDAWARWVEAAPAVRLQGLRFAASQDGRVLVLGTPPPSLPGEAMIEGDDIVWPAGCGWHPAVAPAVVRRLCGAGPDTVVLWEQGGVQLLGRELFVPASRTAARLTAEGAP